MGGVAIEIRGLRKSYGSIEAVRGIDLSVPEGEVFALLGPNGAGKTTTVEILEGYRRRDAGEVRVLGFDPARGERALKEQLGIVLQSSGIDPYLTVSEVIDLYRRAYPQPRDVDDVMEIVGLSEQEDTAVRKLSGGQLRRLDMALALVGDPRLLFLDEPTTGFDPSARRHAWDVVKNLTALGKTIFLTTHYMEEAQFLAKRVAIIVDGNIVADAAPSELVGRHAPATTIRFRPAPGAPPLPDQLARDATVLGDSVELRTENATRALHELTGWALQQGGELDALEVKRMSLEDVYLDITRRSTSTT